MVEIFIGMVFLFMETLEIEARKNWKWKKTGYRWGWSTIKIYSFQYHRGSMGWSPYKRLRYIGAQEHKCLGLYCYYSAAHAPFLWELSHEPNFSSGAHNCVNLHQRKSLGKRKMFSNATLDRSLSIFCFFPITIKRNFSLVSPDIPINLVSW